MVWTFRGSAFHSGTLRRSPSRRVEFGREEYPMQPFSKNRDDSSKESKMEFCGSESATLAWTSNSGEPLEETLMEIKFPSSRSSSTSKREW